MTDNYYTQFQAALLKRTQEKEKREKRTAEKTGLSMEERAKLKDFNRNEHWWMEFEKKRPNHLLEIQERIVVLQIATKLMMMDDEEFLEQWPNVQICTYTQIRDAHLTSYMRLESRFVFLTEKKKTDREEIARLQKIEADSLQKWKENKAARKALALARKGQKAKEMQEKAVKLQTKEK